MVPHILIVDDDEDIRNSVSLIVGKTGYTYVVAENGEYALEKIKTDRFNIAILDVTMPVMDGITLLDEIHQRHSDIVCLMLTSHTDPEIILSTMNDHKAYAYLTKPFEPNLLVEKINKAYEFYCLRTKISALGHNESAFHTQVLSVFDWKDALLKKHENNIAHTIVRQLNIGLFHGGGIGALISTMSLFFSKSKLNDETKKYEMPANLYELIKSSYDSALTVTKSFSQLQRHLLDDEEVQTTDTVFNVRSLFDEVGQELDSMTKIKNQRVIINKIPDTPNLETSFEPEKMKVVVRELLINAMKYSPHQAVIYVIFFLRGNYLEVKILNPAMEFDGGFGVDESNEHLVFEPFFRLTPVVYDDYTLEEFGNGLGLAVVKKIISQHGANISICNLKNYSRDETTDQEDAMDVCVTLRFNTQEIDSEHLEVSCG